MKLWILALACALVAITGCAGELEDGDFPKARRGGSGGSPGDPPMGGGGGSAGSPPVDVPQDDDCVTKIFMKSCVTGCHSAANVQIENLGKIDLETAGVGARLIDERADKPTGTCAPDGKLIDTENPGQSVLLQRVKGKACGAPMPFGTMGLPATEQQCLETWINKFRR